MASNDVFVSRTTELYALRAYLRALSGQSRADPNGHPPLVRLEDFCRMISEGLDEPPLLAVDLMGCSDGQIASLANAASDSALAFWDPVSASRVSHLHSRAGFVLCGRNSTENHSIVTEFSDWLRRSGLGSSVRELAVASPQLVADVEVCSLNTAGRAEGRWHSRVSLPHPVYDIHAHAYVQPAEPFDLAAFDTVTFTSRRSWKIITRDGRYLEDVGYTTNRGLHEIEFWPDFCGRTHIRSLAPVVNIDFGKQTPFLLGYDGAHYHWILNWLPRLMAFDLFEERLGKIKDAIILTGRLSQTARDSLIELGASLENVIELDQLVNYTAPAMIVPSFISNSRVSKNISDWYRRKFPGRTAAKRERIYITRSDATWTGMPRRQVTNEAEVIRFLSSLGFKAHVLSAYSFRQQVELFQSAECVVAPHGAGFANMVFSPPGTSAVIFENSYRHTFIQEVLTILGHRPEILDCVDIFDPDIEQKYMAEGTDETEIWRNRNLRVSIEALHALLGRVLL